MLWAALATFLWSKPAWVQAVFVGVCSGLFLGALTGNWLNGDLDPAGLFVFVGFSLVAGGLFYLARTAIPRPSASEIGAGALPVWELVLFPLLWLLGVASLVRALFEQGFGTAILLILPLMLLGPVALDCARALRDRYRTSES